MVGAIHCQVKDFLNTYGLDIKFYKLEIDEGVGQSRQLGIEKAIGDYILFFRR